MPRLWLKFQQGVFAKMPPAKLDRLLGIPILGRIVARKVLKGLGLDQVRQAGSASAPIPAELIRWYRRLGLELFEGYAMTEDFAYSHTSNAQFQRAGLGGRADARRARCGWPPTARSSSSRPGSSAATTSSPS